MFSQTNTEKWTYKFNLNGGYDGTSSFDILSGNKMVCKLDGIDYGQKRHDDKIGNKHEMEINAKIIASAPQMAAALMDLITFADKDESEEAKAAVKSAAQILNSLGRWPGF